MSASQNLPGATPCFDPVARQFRYGLQPKVGIFNRGPVSLVVQRVVTTLGRV